MVSGTQPKTPSSRGDIYWIQLGEEDGIAGGISHPHVVIEESQTNQDEPATVMVCALTSNVKRASWPGNVLLDKGEANLPRQSVVEVSKVTTVRLEQLGTYIGTLAEQRVKQIFSGIRLLENSFGKRRSR